MIKIIEKKVSFLILIRCTSHKNDKVKKIDACTNLSKLNNSSQLVVGIYCPGVQHSTKMMSVHKIAAERLYLKNSFIINYFLRITQIRADYYKKKPPANAEGSNIIF